MKKLSQASSVSLKYGWRSGLEESVGAQLEAAGIAFSYEDLTIPYTPLKVVRKYTPDFPLANGIVVETKGRFVTEDRQKIKAVKAQYPDLDLRIVFSRSSTRISKQSKTTYAAWCQALGIPYADKSIPLAWLSEPPNPRSLAVIQRIKEESK